MIPKQLMEEKLHRAFERGVEKGLSQVISVPEGVDAEEYLEFQRKAARYDGLLKLYQQQLVKEVEKQDYITELESVIHKQTNCKRENCYN